MSRPWDDCRFFMVSECLRKNCFYRHHAPAKNAKLCPKWASGACQKLDCDSMVSRGLSAEADCIFLAFHLQTKERNELSFRKHAERLFQSQLQFQTFEAAPDEICDGREGKSDCYWIECYLLSLFRLQSIWLNWKDLERNRHRKKKIKRYVILDFQFLATN